MKFGNCQSKLSKIVENLKGYRFFILRIFTQSIFFLTILYHCIFLCGFETILLMRNEISYGRQEDTTGTTLKLYFSEELTILIYRTEKSIGSLLSTDCSSFSGTSAFGFSFICRKDTMAISIMEDIKRISWKLFKGPLEYWCHVVNQYFSNSNHKWWTEWCVFYESPIFWYLNKHDLSSDLLN